MRNKRNYKVYVPTNYNELAEFVNHKEAIIFVQGNLYDEMKPKAKETKLDRGNKIIGCAAIAAGILTGGVLPIVVGALDLSFTTLLRNKDFDDYDVKINKEEKRIELYMNKRPDKYIPRYDTMEF